jgi:hypothetical protein
MNKSTALSFVHHLKRICMLSLVVIITCIKFRKIYTFPCVYEHVKKLN